MESIKKNRIDVNTFSFIQLDSSVGRERDSDKNVERIQDERKENVRLLLFKTHLFTHSTFPLALTAHTRT